jgi:hypothetical protein
VAQTTFSSQNKPDPNLHFNIVIPDLSEFRKVDGFDGVGTAIAPRSEIDAIFGSATSKINVLTLHHHYGKEIEELEQEKMYRRFRQYQSLASVDVFSK